MTAPILSYPDAAHLIAEHAIKVRGSSGRRIERLDLLAAQNCVLAANVYADRDQPPFPRSTRDGFACHAADLSAGKPIPVTGQLRAGDPVRTAPLPPGEAIEIMTGAPVPPGADAVVMLEHVLRTTAQNTIALAPGRTLRTGENIVATGSEASKGAIIVPAGTRLTPSHIAAAAQCGAATVDTFARPRIAILATGDELVEVDGGAPLPHQIRNSNSYSLAAQVRSAGGNPHRLPVARDNSEHLATSLDRALADADLLLLSGGVSMGQYDLVEQALADRGAEFFFTGVLIQPGKPAVYGRLASTRGSGHTCFLGLPGNPVSTLVTFLLFAAPLIRALSGESDAAPRFTSATLAADFRTRPGLTRFLPAHMKGFWDRTTVAPIAWQGSGDLAATARANCFLVIPPDSECIPAGSAVQVLLAS